MRARPLYALSSCQPINSGSRIAWYCLSLKLQPLPHSEVFEARAEALQLQERPEPFE